MITNLLITGEYTINLGRSQKLSFGDVKVSVKNIPFIRFRPKEVTDNTINYFLDLKERFKYSCHTLELEVSEDTLRLLKELGEKDDLSIVFLYVTVEDDDLKSGISEERLYLVNKCIDTYEIERLIIRDNTNIMHAIEYNELKAQIINTVGNNKKDWIGICGSPLSFGGESCLTAVKARELMANYGENDEYPLPSSKHESMNECGCIRHIIIDNHLISEETTGKSKVGGTNNATRNKSSGLKVMRKFRR